MPPNSISEDAEDSTKGALKFRKVEDPATLEALLASRLPISASMYNCIKYDQTWKSHHQWYQLFDPSVNDLWIVRTYYRGDFGHVINISCPPTVRITEPVRTAFSTWEKINWRDTFSFCAVEFPVTTMVTEISTRHYGNCTRVHPNYLYVMEPEEAKKIQVETEVNVEVKPVDITTGADFIADNWKYRADGTVEYVRDMLDRNLSAGVYINGEIVSGVLMDGHGYLGMLFSEKKVRGKGYGQAAMRQLMKDGAENGLFPACNVECSNKVSNAFQDKVGFRNVGVVDYIFFNKPEY